MHQLTDQVYMILRSRAFARDGRLYEDKIAKAIDYFIRENKPIKLIGFWGVGPKDVVNDSDLVVCDFLSKLNAKIKDIYLPGIEYTFIISTNHGIQNGYDTNIISSYYQSIQNVFQKHNFLFQDLETLWNKYDISLDKITDQVNKNPESWWRTINKAKALEKAAGKRSKNPNPSFSAKRYYVMRQMEKHMLETEFPNSIFHTFSDSSWNFVFPNLPTLYFWAGKRGFSNPPWFVTN